MLNNSTIEAANYTVNQGPAWVADLYLTPPGWVNPAIQALAFFVAIGVAYRLYERGFRVDGPTQLTMGHIAATVVGTIIATLAAASWTSNPYPVDVGIGVLLGWGGQAAVLSVRAREWLARHEPIPQLRRAYGWGALALLAFLGPELIAPGPGRLNLMNARLAITFIAIVMAYLNGREWELEKEEAQSAEA